MLESKITRDILKELRKTVGDDGWWLKVHGSAMQPRGIPDIIGSYQGHFVAMEVKRPHEREDVSPMQRLNLERIQRTNASAFVVTSVLEALDVLDEIDSQLNQ